MPRGRHRHSPPLHRMLPPSAIAGVSLVCALGPWVLTEPVVLRVLAAAAALTAVAGAFVMRRWDSQAGKQVADLTRARASDEWRHEERVAELETDLEESRELRVKLEQRLRAKRTELAGLRNEHAALLRRYATAEAERATALEGRRLLEIEAATPAPALPPGPTGGVEAVAAPADGDAIDSDAIERDDDARDGGDDHSAESAEAAENADTAETVENGDGDDAGDTGSGETGEAGEAGGNARSGEDAEESAEEGAESDAADEVKGSTSGLFSPEGSRLFLRASTALGRLDADQEPSDEEPSEGEGSDDEGSDREPSAEEGSEQEPASQESVSEEPAAEEPAAKESAVNPAAKSASKAPSAEERADDAAAPKEPVTAGAERAGGAESALEDEAPGDSGAVDGHEHAAAAPTAAPSRVDDTAAHSPVQPVRPVPAAARAAAPVQRPSGHFTVPTAVAVAPASAPVRRPVTEGGFDFFGSKTDTSAALESVQNQDLADVVGQEALDLHKAEAEAEFKPANAQSRGVGQVIDLTEHDETEHIDMQGLRSAVS
ncbi:hypothetical protein [Streptomyces cadmiisoli]|uniref:Secreted protein n=1 Tax=Streptomyces cadmiisoli TaxID=2184053 RepID=A0A2Z4J014_9ACTN|nr:hypothetical protein [Streptomyces cadmiisoli]AWW38337.1 hypothetical protein DN051_18130 [Streptomyces cadmiisoli]